jgi:transposase
MSNVLEMAKIQSIQSLHAAGWSQRRIARELGVDRGTVAKHLRPLPSDSKPAIPPTGLEGSKPATFSTLPALPALAAEATGRPVGESAGDDCAGASAAAGRRSDCEPFRERIEALLEQQLTARRIWQDLVGEHGFTGAYDSVKRFVRRLGASTPAPFRRLECQPGEEAQVDFGSGAPVVAPEGKRRRTHVFRIVLSHSRKAYSEATFTQTTEDFFRCLENAFAHFGGVPKTLVIDNLKAAVAHPDWFDPELTPKVQSFCQHYGTVILPTRPYTPRHKGKVESGVKYVKRNALQGRTFASLDEQNRHLAEWERTIADTRIHGTTKQQVKLLFERLERPALSRPPLERFACFHEARRKVNRDGHIEVAKAYYSAPPEYLERTVWVRWDARLVRIFNHRFEQVAVHARHEQGRRSTNPEHILREKICGLERGAGYLLGKLRAVGPHTHQWAEAMVNARGVAGTRVLQGLVALTKKHPSETLEKACEIAVSHGSWRLKTIRRLAASGVGDKQQPLPFLDEHPIIRPLADYGAVVTRALQREADRSSMSEGFPRHGAGVRGDEESPGDASRRGRSTFSTRPRSGYPSPGCSSAEPDSVSPDDSSVVPDRSPSTSSASPSTSLETDDE